VPERRPARSPALRQNGLKGFPQVSIVLLAFGLYRFGWVQDREWLCPLGSVSADESQEERNAKTEGCAEGYEGPQGRKADNEDRGASDCEEQPHEPGTNRELMHRNAGMPLFRHNPTSLLLDHPTKFGRGQTKSWNH